MCYNFIGELIIVGLMTMIVGLILSYIFMGKERDNFKYWKLIALIMFLVGVIIHILCEITGINKLYCKYGNACKN